MIAYPLVTSMVSPLIRGLASGSVESGDGGGGLPGDQPTLKWNPSSGVFTSEVGPTPTFTRASGATMVDVNGNVVWGPENLANHSEQFETGHWQQSSLTVIANQLVSPTGAMTADAAIPIVGSNTPYLQLTGLPAASVGQIFTDSIYVHPGNFRYFSLFELSSGTGAGLVVFDLQTGTVSGAANGLTVANGAIQAAGNGWYRISLTAAATTTGWGPRIYPSGAGDNIYPITGNGTDKFYVWGGQTERGSVARAYIPTTDFPVYGPRITYDPVSHKCLGYLAEEQRNNLSTNLTGYTLLNSIVTPNAATSPSGAIDAFLLYSSGATSTVWTYQALATPGAYSVSIFAKAAGKQWLVIPDGNATTVYASFNLVTGTVGTVQAGYTARIQPLPNGWFRCTMTTLSDFNTWVIFAVSDSGSNLTITPNGTDGIYLWGPQVESGAFPTSYIPTTTAAATRSADVCQIGGTDFTSFYNQSEGTFVANFRSTAGDGKYHEIVQFSDSGGNNSNAIIITPTPDLNFEVKLAGINQISIASPIISMANTKTALGYKLNDFSTAKDGVIAGTDSLGTPATIMTACYIGHYSTGLYQINGTIASLTYYNLRLPDAKLIELTS
jgi:hypothetical protein